MKLDVLRKKLPVFVFALVVFQPMLDCLSFWFTRMDWNNTVTLALRLGVLAVTALLGFLLCRRKWVYFAAAAVCLVIGAGHVWALYDYGAPASIVSDLTNYIRVLQLPVMTICLITFLRENERSYTMLKWAMVGSLAIIVVVTALASLTGTEPHTYMDGRGYIGWFNTTNAQSNILCIVVPVAIVWMYEKKGLKSLWFWMAALLGCAALFLLGTRLALLAIVATGFGLGISVALIKLSDWKKGLCFLLVAIVFLLMLPWSPMNSHQGIFDNVQSNRQAIADAKLAAYDLKPLDEEGISAEERNNREKLWQQALYETYYYHANDFVKIFGMEQTMEHYNYSTDVAQITAQRPKKLLFGQMLMENSPPSAKLFGLELQRFTVGKNNYDVENDLHGIWLLYGWVGLIALGLFLAYFVFLIVRALLQNAKRYFTLDAAAWGIGFVCCMMHIYLTAGVLRRPNSSFYLAAALAAIYYLTKVKTYPEK